MEDLRAVAYGHAVSSLGYEIKVGKEEVNYRDAQRHVCWPFKKQKDGSLLIKSKDIAVKHHGVAAGKPDELGEREARMIPELVLKGLKVLRIRGEFK